MPITDNFNRIYTPQTNMKRDIRALKKNNSKTKTMATSDIDGKNSTEPMVVSSINKSNGSTNCYSAKRSQKFRINSAHTKYVNRLNSTGNWMLKNELDKPKFTSISSKDWKIFSVRESNRQNNTPRRVRD